MDSRDRDILERAVRSIAEQAAKADKLVDEAIGVNAVRAGSWPS
jgi:hypothetical protein